MMSVEVELNEEGKPQSFSDALTIVIEFLDMGDIAFRILADQKDQELPTGNDIQVDLARLRDNLTPELDEYLHALMLKED